jgi:DNA-binding MarR family transcriptional regulator
LQPNPHHRRAHLVVLTKRGKGVFEAAIRLQTPWANDLARGFGVKELAATHAIVAALCERLD